MFPLASSVVIYHAEASGSGNLPALFTHFSTCGLFHGDPAYISTYPELINLTER
jgi:hypothetical protein